MVKEQITPQAVKEKSDLDFSKKKKGTVLSHDDIKFYQTMEMVLSILNTCTMRCPSHLNIRTYSCQTTASERNA